MRRQRKDENLHFRCQIQFEGQCAFTQELGLEDYMSQLDADHGEYLKDDQVGSSHPERQVQAETANRRRDRPTQKGAEPVLRDDTPGNGIQ